MVSTQYANSKRIFVCKCSINMLDGHRITKNIDVQWGDMDAAQHVNNVVYLRWVESARIAYFLDLNGGELSNEDNVGPVVAHQDCKYIRPVTFPDTVLVGVERKEIQDDRIVLETKIFSKSQNKLVAISTQQIVSYDFKRKMKAPLPLNWVYND